jgi:hypothetical protein
VSPPEITMSSISGCDATYANASCHCLGVFASETFSTTSVSEPIAYERVQKRQYTGQTLSGKNSALSDVAVGEPGNGRVFEFVQRIEREARVVGRSFEARGMNCVRIGSAPGFDQSIEAIMYGETRTAIGARAKPSRTSSKNAGSTSSLTVSSKSPGDLIELRPCQM